jgi:hypothetical protein
MNPVSLFVMNEIGVFISGSNHPRQIINPSAVAQTTERVATHSISFLNGNILKSGIGVIAAGLIGRAVFIQYSNRQTRNTLTTSLNLWAGADDARQQAACRILDCYNNRARSLDLSQLNLTSCPPQIGSLTHLTRLDLSGNNLTTLPEEISSLTNLTELYLDRQLLGQVAMGRVGMGNRFLTAYPHLSLQERGVIITQGMRAIFPSRVSIQDSSEIFDAVAQLPAADREAIITDATHRMNPGMNRDDILDTIRAGSVAAAIRRAAAEQEPIAQEALRRILDCYDSDGLSLDLSQLGLTDCPPEVGCLRNLTRLDLTGNHLSQIPTAIEILTNLSELYLDQQLIRQMAMSPLGMGNRFLTAYPHLSLEERAVIITQGMRAISLGRVSIQSASEIFDTVAQLPTEVMEDFMNHALGLINPEMNGADIGHMIMRLPYVIENTRRAYQHLIALNPNHARQIEEWSVRISGMEDYRRNRALVIQRIGGYLTLAETDPAFKDVFFQIIEGANATCGDRMALSILELSLAHKKSQFLAKPSMIEQDMKDLSWFIFRGLWAMDRLQEVAMDKVARLRQRGINADEIEVYLGFPVLLKQRLQLEIDVDGMLYGSLSRIEDSEINAAARMIEDALRSREAQIEILSRQDLWVQALAKHRPESYAEILRRRDEASEAKDPNYEQIQENFQTEINRLTQEVMEACGI